MSKGTILVTGGLGYIGSHTVVALLQKSFDVHIADDLSNADESVLDQISQITGANPAFTFLDLRDDKGVLELFKENQFDAVIHFAASKSVGESAENPLLYYDNNLRGMVNLLQGMRATNVSNIVFSSSCTVYGQPEVLPVTEQTPIRPAESPYGNTKKIGEDILRDSTQAYEELNAIALRYFNPVGAHDSGLIGEKPKGIPNNLMPYLMQVATGDRKELSVFGNDYETPDGTAIRDYIHVEDLAKAHAIAVTRQITKKQKSSFEIFNLGSGSGYSVLEIIQSFEKVNGVKVNYAVTERRAGDIEKIYADNSYAVNELGWKPTKSLDDMMSSAWKWQQSLDAKKLDLMNKEIINAIIKTFEEEFKTKPLLARAPGRINLIGEHTDYNNGFVLPASIDKASYVAIERSGNDQSTLIALDLNERFSFSVKDDLKPSNVSWANYFLGVVDEFKKRDLDVEGFNMVFSSDVPLGAGLSSSAALESSLGYALSELFGHHVDRIELSKIGQAAEHNFAGTKCGIMDQYASCLGKANHAILIDCESLVPEYIPCRLGDYHLVLFDSCVKHNLVETEYNTRRQQCEEGVAILQKKYPKVKSLRDANLRKLESVKDDMDLVVYQRCHYVITEYDRVMAAANALRNQKIGELGNLMWQTHSGLSNDYEVSCEELDTLVAIAQENSNIIGARMMGGGFGGCTINIVKNKNLDKTIAEVLEEYKKRTNKKIKHYSVSIADGASLL